MNLEDSSQKPSKTEGSNRPTDQHSGQTPPPISPTVTVSQSPLASNEQCESQKKHRDWVDYTTLGLETFGLAVLIAYTTFAALQWCEMRESVKKMDEGIIAANRSAAAAETANAQALESDRPWVGVDDFEPKTLEPDVAKSVAFDVINAGKRPALVPLGEMNVKVYKVFPENPSYAGIATGPSESLLLPGIRINIESKPVVVTSKLIAEMKTTNQSLYIYAHIEYIDVGTQNHHTTHVCERYRPERKAFSICPFYNDAN
jgi:hypothetical protein